MYVHMYMFISRIDKVTYTFFFLLFITWMPLLENPFFFFLIMSFSVWKIINYPKEKYSG